LFPHFISAFYYFIFGVALFIRSFFLFPHLLLYFWCRSLSFAPSSCFCIYYFIFGVAHYRSLHISKHKLLFIMLLACRLWRQATPA
jgi:hypothetical protein